MGGGGGGGLASPTHRVIYPIASEFPEGGGERRYKEGQSKVGTGGEAKEKVERGERSPRQRLYVQRLADPSLSLSLSVLIGSPICAELRPHYY